jgi:hypothetical protein
MRVLLEGQLGIPAERTTYLMGASSLAWGQWRGIPFLDQERERAAGRRHWWMQTTVCGPSQDIGLGNGSAPACLRPRYAECLRAPASHGGKLVGLPRLCRDLCYTLSVASALHAFVQSPHGTGASARGVDMGCGAQAREAAAAVKGATGAESSRLTVQGTLPFPTHSWPPASPVAGPTAHTPHSIPTLPFHPSSPGLFLEDDLCATPALLLSLDALRWMRDSPNAWDLLKLADCYRGVKGTVPPGHVPDTSEAAATGACAISRPAATPLGQSNALLPGLPRLSNCAHALGLTRRMAEHLLRQSFPAADVFDNLLTQHIRKQNFQQGKGTGMSLHHLNMSIFAQVGKGTAVDTLSKELRSGTQRSKRSKLTAPTLQT